MINLSNQEAILFRILSDFFGKDQVIPNMSVSAVCGDKLPADYRPKASFDIKVWSKKNKCLFTILDKLDNPCLVIEFFSGYSKSVDLTEVEHQTYMPDILQSAGILYITMTDSEFSEIIDPAAHLDFVAFLKSKVGDEDAR